MSITIDGSEYQVPTYSGTTGNLCCDNSGSSDWWYMGQPIDYDEAKKDAEVFNAITSTCAYCGCRLTDNGKPNCSQCGAPRGG